MVFMTGAVRARAPPVVDFEFLLGQYTGNAVVDRLLYVAARAEEDRLEAAESLAASAREAFYFFPPPLSGGGSSYGHQNLDAT